MASVSKVNFTVSAIHKYLLSNLYLVLYWCLSMVKVIFVKSVDNTNIHSHALNNEDLIFLLIIFREPPVTNVWF